MFHYGVSLEWNWNMSAYKNTTPVSFVLYTILTHYLDSSELRIEINYQPKKDGWAITNIETGKRRKYSSISLSLFSLLIRAQRY